MHQERSTRFTRVAQFDQETDAVSVRKAKNIASEVDRKRTKRISLLLASSIGFPPFPSPGKKESNINTRNRLLFSINPCQGVIIVVNVKRITISNSYDNVYGEQNCNSLFLGCLSRRWEGRQFRRCLVRVGTIPKGSSALP
jgi:hypothetical protein